MNPGLKIAALTMVLDNRKNSNEILSIEMLVEEARVVEAYLIEEDAKSEATVSSFPTVVQ